MITKVLLLQSTPAEPLQLPTPNLAILSARYLWMARVRAQKAQALKTWRLPLHGGPPRIAASPLHARPLQATLPAAQLALAPAQLAAAPAQATLAALPARARHHQAAAHSTLVLTFKSQLPPAIIPHITRAICSLRLTFPFQPTPRLNLFVI